MPCFHPIQAWKTEDGIKFYNPYKDNRNHKGFKIPCRQCTGCRSEYSRQWAMRILHESSLHPNNIFITLTYDNEHLPEYGTLVKKHFQDFMKRLRKKYSKKKIRYYQCGEYGENFGRPHYHAIIFNHTFPDMEKVPGKHKDLYTSETLKKIWGKGHVSIGTVNFETAAYVANYVQKKINGKNKQEHYELIDYDTGEIVERQQEYATMSRRPGIAGDWLAKYQDDVYPSDFITINGKKMKPPKAYDRQYELLYPEIMADIKKDRRKMMDEMSHLFTKEALAYREKNHKARMAIYKREKL